MTTEPQWHGASSRLAPWLDPPWRRRRSAERRAAAWAATSVSLAAYLFAFLWLGADAAPATLVLLPCLVAGWCFGASGGLLVALLTSPLHAWLVGIEPAATVLGFGAALAVGVSVGLARDLHERLHERTADLMASEDRYRQLVDNSPEGVLVHERGVIVFANPSIARLVECEDACKLVGRTLVTLAPFEDRDALAAAFIFAPPEASGPRCIEARLARPDGETIDVIMTTMPIRYRDARANLVLVREASLVRAPTRLKALRVAARPA